MGLCTKDLSPSCVQESALILVGVDSRVDCMQLRLLTNPNSLEFLFGAHRPRESMPRLEMQLSNSTSLCGRVWIFPSCLCFLSFLSHFDQPSLIGHAVPPVPGVAGSAVPAGYATD